MPRARVEIHTSEFRKYLRHAGMVDMIDERVQRIADAAGEGFKGDTLEGRSRAVGGIVSTTVEAMLAERRNHALTRAIDAGR